MSKGSKETFLQRRQRRGKEHRKRCPTPSAIGEMQANTRTRPWTLEPVALRALGAACPATWGPAGLSELVCVAGPARPGPPPPNSRAAVWFVGSPPRASQQGSKTTRPPVTPGGSREAQTEGRRGSQLCPPGLQTPEEAERKQRGSSSP